MARGMDGGVSTMTYVELNHRYTLRRSWMGNGGVVNFIMLNPSTADDVFDDATIRKCVGFSKRWGYCGLVVTNLYAYRATNPAVLRTLLKTPGGFRLGIGERTAEHIDREAKMAHMVICAWGDNVSSMQAVNGINRDLDVISMLRYRDLYCIRRTAKGNPAHPGREPYTDEPQMFYPKLFTEEEIKI